jgi:Flp pilus assembly protein TadD
MRAVFATLIAKAKVNLPVPLQILVFRNTKEMRQFAPLWRGKPTEVAGLFAGGDDQTFIMLDMSVENPWEVVFHEYAHQLMSGNISSGTDPWFEEGFAEYFSNIQVDNKQANVGRIPEQDYLILQHTGTIRISDLFRVQQHSSTYNESGDHRTAFYAESGFLVHYIYDNALMAKVADYFDLVKNKNVPVDTAIQQAFGMSPAQFDKELRSYISVGQSRYYAIPTPAIINRDNFTVTPLSASNAKAIEADVHLHSTDYQAKAAEEFQDVLKADPNNAAALRGMGYWCLLKSDYHAASEYFSKAAGVNSDDPRVLYYSALLVQREGGFKSDGDPRIKKIQQQLEKSVQLDPEFADSYNLLSYIYYVGHRNDLALKATAKAVELNPGNTEYRFNLVQVLVAMHAFSDANKVLEQLANSSDQAVAVRAQQTLATVQEAKKVADAGGKVEVSTTREIEVRDQNIPPPSEANTGRNSPVLPAMPAKFLKGTLAAVDCSRAPAAMLDVVSSGTHWKIHVGNSERLVLIGADAFSCGWKNRKVAVNFHPSGDSAGEVISLELQ